MRGVDRETALLVRDTESRNRGQVARGKRPRAQGVLEPGADGGTCCRQVDDLRGKTCSLSNGEQAECVAKERLTRVGAQLVA